MSDQEQPPSDDLLIGHLQILTERLGFRLSQADLFRVFEGSRDRYTVEDAIKALDFAGFKADFGRDAPLRMDPILFPVIGFDPDGAPYIIEAREEGNRFVVIDLSSGNDQPQIWRADNPRLKKTKWILRAERLKRLADPSLVTQGHWFWSAFRDLKGVYIQIMVAAAVTSILGLATSIFTMVVYDRILPNEAIDSLLALVVGVGFALLFDFLIKSLRSRFVDVAGQAADLKIAERLFNQLLSLKMRTRGGQNGRMASILRDFEVVRDFFTSASLITLVDLPFLLVFVAVIWIIGGPLAIVPAIAVPTTLFICIVVQPLLNKYTRESSAEGQTKQSVLMETLTGIETLKTVGAEPVMRARWRDTVQAQANSGGKTRLVSQGAVNLTMLVQQVAQVSVIFYGVFLIRDGTISMGALIACVILTGKTLAPLSQLAQVLTRLNQARVAYRQIDELMAQEVERDADRRYLSRQHIDGNIELRDVGFAYGEDGGDVLKRINLTIKPGEKVAIMGPVGSGKSTLARLILGLYEPTEGTVLLDGLDARAVDPADRTRNFGAVLQDCWLFSGTLAENIAAGRFGVTDEDIHKAAHLSLADRIAHAHPHGYDMTVTEGGAGVSGGQRQAIAIARALVGNPSCLVMDEPTSSMDVQTEGQVISNINDWLEDSRTLILVTHRTSLLKLVDRVIVLNSGEIVRDVRTEELVQSARSQAPAKAG